MRGWLAVGSCSAFGAMNCLLEQKRKIIDFDPLRHDDDQVRWWCFQSNKSDGWAERSCLLSPGTD
jgi:hypothetical protein